MTTDETLDALKASLHDMQEAQAKIFWHLSRAAQACITGLLLGEFYEKEIASASEWKAQYDAANLKRISIHWPEPRPQFSLGEAR